MDEEIIPSTCIPVRERSSRPSPAAQCIQLCLLGQTFQPVFTHQVFPGEVIRGYKAQEEETKSIDPAVLKNDDVCELSINVALAPSCRQCRLTMEIRRPSRKRNLRSSVARGSAKRARRVSPEDDEEGKDGITIPHEGNNSDVKTSPDNSRNDTNVSNGDEDSSEEENEGKNGVSQQQRMPQAEIKERISAALPEIVSDDEDLQVEDDYLESPLGNALEEYEHKGITYCMTIANGPDVVDYHSKVQHLALFYIETANDVNVADESEGSWRVLYLFRKHSSYRYSFVGYMTLFHFTSPFRKPVPGIIVRVCQALFLPQYQRNGHGRRMLTALHKWADGAYNAQLSKDLMPDDVVEINVEDPSSGYTALRNRVDYQRFLAAFKSGEGWFKQPLDASADISTEDFFDLLKDEDASAAATEAKITCRQAQVVYEIFKLQQLRDFIVTSVESDDEKDMLEKRYRLMVKKRIQRDCKEELSACQDKEEMKALIGKLYEEAIKHYDTILSGISKARVEPVL